MRGAQEVSQFKGPYKPDWMSDTVFAEYLAIWDTDDFKQLCEKNKKNRNSDCGGMGPSLHTTGSILITEHRRRVVKYLLNACLNVAHNHYYTTETGLLYLLCAC